MTSGTFLQLAFIGFLVMLRLLERALERSRTPFDPTDRITDYRRHYDRKPRDAIGKDVTDYDSVAIERLRRLHDRRTGKKDTGLRRRRTDHNKINNGGH